jgi:uncharacterized protein with PIN domain
MNENEFSSIVFLPVCKKCLKIIWEEVDCTESIRVINNTQMLSAFYDIKPDKCPHCNAIIDRIEMPTSLPFSSEKYVKE